MSVLHFFDVGANVGQTFDDYLRLHGEFDGCDLWCFEPSPRHLPKLMEKMGLLRERYRIHVCPFGLAAKTGVRSFSVKDDPRGDSFEVRQARTAPIMLGYALEVAAFGVVDFILTHTQPQDRIVLKLDCEGAEYEILQALLEAPGCEEAHRRVEVKLVEFHAPHAGAEMVPASGSWQNRAQLVERYEKTGKPIGPWLW